MAVKTITIDMEAYNLLSAVKKEERDSFSKVIKRHLKTTGTAADLLAMKDDLHFSETTLNAMDRMVESRKESPAESPKW